MRRFERVRFCGSEFERGQQIHDAEKRETVLAFEERKMSFEYVGGSQHDVRTRRNEFAPECTPRIVNWNRHKTESAAERIGADEEGPIALGVRSRGRAGIVIDVVFVRILTGGDDAEFFRGSVGAKVMDFAGGVTCGREQKIRTAACAFHLDA